MSCRSPRLFRHRQTNQYWIAACQRFACAGCIHRVARRWRAILNWASAHGAAPEYFLTLTLREPLPLWRQAPAEAQEAMREQALALAERLTRALSRLVEEVREQYCVFRTDSTTHFGRIRPRVSGQIDHPLRLKSTSRFGGNRPA
jgi:hypothetical protein